MLPTYHATYRPACGAEIEPSIKATLAAKEVAEWVRERRQLAKQLSDALRIAARGS